MVEDKKNEKATGPYRIRNVIGENVAALRERHNIRQQDVSAQMRARGVKWEPSTLSALEAGEKAVTLEALILLADALNELARGAEVGVPDLLADTGRRVTLNSSVKVDSSALVELLNGRGTALGVSKPQERKDPLYIRFKKRDPLILALLGEHADVVEEGRYDPHAEADRFQARKLGRPVEEVTAAAIGVFGVSLTEERDETEDIIGLTAKDSTQRGHVTRMLARKVRERLEAEARGELTEPLKSDKESQEWPTSRSARTGSTWSGGKTRSGVKGASSSRSSGMPARSKRR